MEYGMIAAGIVLVVATAAATLGNDVSALFTSIAGRSDWYCCTAKTPSNCPYGKVRNNRAGRPSRLRRRDRRPRWRPADHDGLQDPGRRRGLDRPRCSVEQDDRFRRVSRAVALQLSRRYGARATAGAARCALDCAYRVSSCGRRRPENHRQRHSVGPTGEKPPPPTPMAEAAAASRFH